MRCPSCDVENAQGALYCEVCGHELAKPARRPTVVESAPNPHAKRRTAIEAPAELPPRPPFAWDDPFARSVVPRPAGPEPKKPRTQLEKPKDAGRIRGALVIERPGDAGALAALRGHRTVIGRGADADVVLDDPRVSDPHAYLFVDEAGARLLEVSSNGSIVDGRVVNGGTAEIRHGSVLQVGQARLVLLLVPDAALEGK